MYHAFFSILGRSGIFIPMQPAHWLLITIMVVPLVLVMANRLRMDLAALIMAAALGILQLLGWGMLGPSGSPKDAVRSISGLSQPVIITLVALFILTRGLEKSGLARWIASHILRLAGQDQARLIALFAATTAFLSLFVNNLAAGALLLPSAMEVARQTGIKPSKLLIPVSYGSMLGGTATYFTTANILVSDLLRIATPPQAPLPIYAFTPTGGLVALAGILFFYLLGQRLLPERDPAPEQVVVRCTGSELEDLYQLGERLWQAQVLPGSPLAGQPLSQSEIGRQWGVTVAAIRRSRGDFLLPRPLQEIHSKDTLLLVGREDKISQMTGLGLDIQPADTQGHLSRQGITFGEILLAPHSSAENKTLKEINFRQRFGLTVVALKRLSRSYRTDVGDLPLRLGDSLLAIGPTATMHILRNSSDWIVIEPHPGDQPVNIRQAAITLTVMLAAVAASVAGAPVYLCMLVGAIIILLLKVISMEEAYQLIEWQAVFIIAGMYTTSLAMVQTGLAELIGKGVLEVVTPLGPLGLAAGAYLLTALLTQVMGGQVAALITGPVVISAAIHMGVNPQAIVVATATGCSASFLTPMAHPVNILMIAPANYRFSDFFRTGWMLTVLSFVMLLAGLVLFWKLI